MKTNKQKYAEFYVVGESVISACLVEDSQDSNKTTLIYGKIPKEPAQKYITRDLKDSEIKHLRNFSGGTRSDIETKLGKLRIN